MQNNLLEFTCHFCGEITLTERWRLKSGRKKYCSRSCTGKARMATTDYSGDKNPNWKGGISKDHYHYKLLQKERYPERVAARVAVAREIRSGRMTRGTCEECGEIGHAHHDDYSKPLEVRWFCRKHHREICHGGKH